MAHNTQYNFQLHQLPLVLLIYYSLSSLTPHQALLFPIDFGVRGLMASLKTVISCPKKKPTVPVTTTLGDILIIIKNISLCVSLIYSLLLQYLYDLFDLYTQEVSTYDSYMYIYIYIIYILYIRRLETKNNKENRPQETKYHPI